MEEDEDAAEAAANARMGLTVGDGATNGTDGPGGDDDVDDAEPGMQARSFTQLAGHSCLHKGIHLVIWGNAVGCMLGCLGALSAMSLL